MDFSNGTAVSDQAPNPVNYTAMQVPVDPVGSFLKAAQQSAQIGQTNAQTQQIQAAAVGQQLQNQRMQNYQAAYQQFAQNPTPQGAVQMAMAYPEVASNVQQAWNGYNEQERQQRLDVFAPITSALQNGRLDLANNLVQQRIDALQNTPGLAQDPELQRDLNGAQQFQQLLQHDAQNGTQHALAFAYGTLAAAQGPQDFMQHFGQGQTMPSTIGQAQANVGFTQAETQNVNSAIQNRAAQFGLDQNQFQAGVQFKLRELNYLQNAPAMDPATRAQADQSAVDSVAFNQLAARTGNLANQIGVLDQNGQWSAGTPGRVQMGWQNFWGSQNNVNTLKQEYQQVMGSLGAFGGAGVGDADKKNLASGIPDQNASPVQIQQFMQSMQNAQVRAARIADGKSSWAYSYGRLGPATSDATINGIQVAKGTSFPKYMSQLLAPNSKAPSPFPAPNAPPGVQTGVQPGAPATAGAPLTGNMSRYNKYLSGGQ